MANQSVHRRHALLNHKIDQHGDVTVTAVVDGQVLQYASASATWVNVTLSLSDLSDINITTPAAGDILQYDGVDSWDNVPASSTGYPPELGHAGI